MDPRQQTVSVDRTAPPHLDAREAAVLSELARDGDAQVGFQGLRRRLDVHQQTLARLLRRLRRGGLVDRSPTGYRVTETGVAALGGRVPEAPRTPSLAILSATLPPQLAAETVAARLSRRWFQGLRWYGRADGPGESTLTWLVEGGGLVRLRVAGGTLRLEAEPAPGATDAAFAAARPVLSAVADLYDADPADPAASWRPRFAA